MDIHTYTDKYITCFMKFYTLIYLCMCLLYTNIHPTYKWMGNM